MPIKPAGYTASKRLKPRITPATMKNRFPTAVIFRKTSPPAYGSTLRTANFSIGKARTVGTTATKTIPKWEPAVRGTAIGTCAGRLRLRTCCTGGCTITENISSCTTDSIMPIPGRDIRGRRPSSRTRRKAKFSISSGRPARIEDHHRISESIGSSTAIQWESARTIWMCTITSAVISPNCLRIKM